MYLYECSVQYVVLLLLAAVCYFIYRYVTVCMFCALHCVIIICCYLLFSNNLIYVFQFLLRVCCLFVCLFVLNFVYFLYAFPFYIAVYFYFFTSLPTAATGLKFNCTR